MEKQKSIPANRIPLTQRFKSLKDSLYLRSSTPFGGAKGKLEDHAVEHEGNITGNILTHEGETVMHQASADMQESGKDLVAAKAAGVKEKDVVRTKASKVAEKASEDDQMRPEPSKDNPVQDKGGFEAEDVDLSAPESKSVETKDKPKEGKIESASLFAPAKGKTSSMKPAEGDFKAKKDDFKAPESNNDSVDTTKKEKNVSKPDKSMSNMASQESAETDGGDDLTKSNDGVPVSKPNYDIKAAPGAITYTKKAPPADDKAPVIDYSKQPKAPSKPEEPKWKTRPETKALAARASQHRKAEQAKTASGMNPDAARMKPRGMGKSLDDKYKIEKMAQSMEKVGGESAAWQKLFMPLKKSYKVAEEKPTQMEKAAGALKGRKTTGKFHPKLKKMFMLRKSDTTEYDQPGPSASGLAALAHSSLKKDAPAMPAPAVPAPAKQTKQSAKKEELLRMARMGKPRPMTSTPIGHAYANYTDPNSFSFDPKFAALIARTAPSWTKK